jgi:hypothetical protein
MGVEAMIADTTRRHRRRRLILAGLVCAGAGLVSSASPASAEVRPVVRIPGLLVVGAGPTPAGTISVQLSGVNELGPVGASSGLGLGAQLDVGLTSTLAIQALLGSVASAPPPPSD